MISASALAHTYRSRQLTAAKQLYCAIRLAATAREIARAHVGN